MLDEQGQTLPTSFTMFVTTMINIYSIKSLLVTNHPLTMIASSFNQCGYTKPLITTGVLTIVVIPFHYISLIELRRYTTNHPERGTTNSWLITCAPNHNHVVTSDCHNHPSNYHNRPPCLTCHTQLLWCEPTA